MTKAAYIAAPLAAPTPELRYLNIRRAEALATLAARDGRAPLVVHSNAERIYGCDDDDAARARGLVGSQELLRCVMMRSNGELWVLTGDDGELSDGVKMEVQIWHRYRKNGVRRGSWEQWRNSAEANGLGDLWKELALPTVAA